MTPLDSINCALDGVNLIEAAAGTGKTYNIQNLAARLIVERGLPISALAVTTFTEAAARELRERLRQILTALRRLADRELGDDSDSRESRLLRRAIKLGTQSGLDTETSRRQCRERLERALLDFDQAAVSTIHGFCQKLLRENAFESGESFSPELLDDDGALLDSQIRDWWRRRLYRDEFALRFDCLYQFDYEKMAAAVKSKLARPEAVLLYRGRAVPAVDSTAEAAAVAAERLGTLADIPGGDELRTIAPLLIGAYGIEKNSGESKICRVALPELERYKNNRVVTPELIAVLRRLTPDALCSALGKAGLKQHADTAIRNSRFFNAVGEIVDALDAFCHRVTIDAAAEISASFCAEKHRRNLLTFDDLLQLTDAALEKRPEFLAALRERYQAGIVDEFQDTDPLQYRIFHRIFARVGGTLFMVGDPRQAIYSFRGGDLYTYLQARADTPPERRFTLSCNYRSSPAMIAAVNRIFTGRENAFRRPELDLPTVTPPADTDRRVINAVNADGSEAAAFELAITDSSDTAIPCAAKIVAMLTDPTFLLPSGDGAYRRCRPQDIAVLCRDWRLGRNIRRRLADANVPAAIYKGENIFSTQTAGDLLALLRAVADPGNRRTAAGALASELGGFSVAELVMETNSKRGTGNGRFETARRQLAELGEIWRKSSFSTMFSRMLEVFNIPVRLAGQPGGERRLTDLIQLGDLLQSESRRHGFTVEALLRYLDTECGTDHSETESNLQMLDTDRSAVKIMTIHSSKGLEFPVCVIAGLHFPALSSRNRDKAAPFHRNGHLALDLALGSNVPEVADEAFEERLRLAYVALTRGKYRTVLVTPEPARGTPLDYLLTRHGIFAPEKEFNRTAMPDFAFAGVYTDLEFAEMPPLAMPVQPDGLFSRDWRIASFSMLAAGRDGHTDGERDMVFEDRLDDEPQSEPEPGLSTRLSGTAFGSAVHHIFENLDFTASEPEITDATRRALAFLNPEPGDINYVATAIGRTLDLPLPTGDGGTMRLSGVKPNDRVSEMRFHYQFRHGFDVRDVFEAANCALDTPLICRGAALVVARGFMTGAIDLVFRHNGRFYLLDWKTNRLGSHASDYNTAALENTMNESLYHLQYLIYITAFWKYLAVRLHRPLNAADYDEFFGGVFYMFVRGTLFDAPGSGVYFARPSYPAIAKLAEVIG